MRVREIRRATHHHDLSALTPPIKAFTMTRASEAVGMRAKKHSGFITRLQDKSTPLIHDTLLVPAEVKEIKAETDDLPSVPFTGSSLPGDLTPGKISVTFDSFGFNPLAPIADFPPLNRIEYQEDGHACIDGEYEESYERAEISALNLDQNDYDTFFDELVDGSNGSDD